ncbi:src-like-adapter 2 isoform X6 [Tyto alba]|uniref:src-like-adapter 2 isoform X6 n=1 Tax=Tyto alba TaxID=56313 RepID=UPI001C669272|nr:src-like-adapter 2 isoform X6 [Tyto alba]
MGSQPSRERPLSAPPAVAKTLQPPLPPQAAPCSPLALALCDFPSGTGAATVLRMGEQLRILAEDGEWWLVVSKVSGKECHVPSSCVAKVRHRWLYEGVSRQKAEELLLQPGNRSGSFLIRESQTRQEFREGLRCLLREPCSMERVGVAPVPSVPAVVKKPLCWDKINSSLLSSEATSPPEDDSPISPGLREAIRSYRLLTETAGPGQGPAGKGAKTS